jgi:hypothetical protein
MLQTDKIKTFVWRQPLHLISEHHKQGATLQDWNLLLRIHIFTSLPISQNFKHKFGWDFHLQCYLKMPHHLIPWSQISSVILLISDFSPPFALLFPWNVAAASISIASCVLHLFSVIFRHFDLCKNISLLCQKKKPKYWTKSR